MAKSNHFERTWKPVDFSELNKTSNGGLNAGFATYSNSVGWFNRIMQQPTKRREQVRRYDMMDETVDISRALDIMAEDISSDNADNADTFIIEFPEDTKVKKTIIKSVEDMKLIWKQRINFDINFFDYAREMLKYGCVFFKKNEDYTLSKLEQKRIEGYVLDENDDSKITHYLYNPASPYKNENDDTVGQGGQETETIPVSQMLILKNGEGPYGESVLKRIYRTWRQIQLVEDAVVIYRIVRAPERRVFYIDIGRNPIQNAESYLNRIKNKQQAKQLMKKNGDLETEYNPASTSEDYYIATNSDGRGSRIETLPGASNLDQIQDLVYLNKKLQHGLRIPSGYLEGTYDQNMNDRNWSDGRVGTAYISELRYAGFIIRIQRKLSKELFRFFKSYLRYRGIELPDDVTFKISEPQSFAIYKENELFYTLLNTVNSATNVKGLSTKYILQKFLHLTAEELIENEESFLLETGIPPEAIKEFTAPQIDAIVYGGQKISVVAPDIANKYKLKGLENNQSGGLGF